MCNVQNNLPFLPSQYTNKVRYFPPEICLHLLIIPCDIAEAEHSSTLLLFMDFHFNILVHIEKNQSWMSLIIKLALLGHADATLNKRWARCDVTSGQSCAVSVLLTKSDVTLLLSFDGGHVKLEDEEAVVDRGDRHHVCEGTKNTFNSQQFLH